MIPDQCLGDPSAVGITVAQLLFCEGASLEYLKTLGKGKQLSLSVLDTKEFEVFSFGYDLETWNEGVLVANSIFDASSQGLL